MSNLAFRYRMPIAETMAFEQLYHPNLQMEIADKQSLADVAGAIFVWMFVDGELAGETYGIPLAGCAERIPGLDAISDAEARQSFYCYSNTLLAPFQRRGLGDGPGFSDVMKAQWLGLVAGRGYRFVYGHARPGRSQSLNARFGAEFLAEFADWYGTGETYRLYRMELSAANWVNRPGR